MALLASVIEAEGMGREERGGSISVILSTGGLVEGGRPRTAIDATSGDREELCSSREKKGRQLGLVEEGVEVLTVGVIEPGWLDGGDRRWQGRIQERKIGGAEG